MDTIRFFIALEIPQESKSQLIELQRKLKSIIPELRLTESEKFHLTYAFVGEQPADIKDPLIRVIEKSVEGINPFTIIPGYIDGFPTIHHPNVIWAGVKGDIDRLYLLREKIKDGLSSLNLDTDERRFVPHITLAKIKNLTITPETEAQIQHIMEQPFSPIQVSSVKLFQSVANQGFHQHTTLAEIPLSKTQFAYMAPD